LEGEVAGTEEFGMASYLARVGLALGVLGAAAFFSLRVARRKGWAKQNETRVKMMASLPLGKDVFFVLRCGPDVFALTSGPGGARLMGRWRYEEWLRPGQKADEADVGALGDFRPPSDDARLC
jgi:hypothetical protein